MAGRTESDDDLAPSTVLRCAAVDQGAAPEPMLDGVINGFDGLVSQIKVIEGLRPLKQELVLANRIWAGVIAPTNNKAYCHFQGKAMSSLRWISVIGRYSCSTSAVE
jgi:hypothetical protein